MTNKFKFIFSFIIIYLIALISVEAFIVGIPTTNLIGNITIDSYTNCVKLIDSKTPFSADAIFPVDSILYDIPDKYLKIENNTVVERNQSEKDIVDWELGLNTTNSIALGENARYTERGIAIGHDSFSHSNAVSIGNLTYATSNSIQIGVGTNIKPWTVKFFDLELITSNVLNELDPHFYNWLSTNTLYSDITNFVEINYYPRNNPSGYITEAQADLNYYPISNPSGYVDSSIVNGYATTNWVINELQNLDVITNVSWNESISNNAYIDNNILNITFKTNFAGGTMDTNWVIDNFYPISNPSNYTTMETVTNWVLAQGFITNCGEIATCRVDLILYTNQYVPPPLITNVKNGLDFAIDSIITLNSYHLLAKFSTDKTNGSAPLEVVFTDESVGIITNKSWDFGYTQLENPGLIFTNTFTVDGVYTAELTITTYGGYSSSTSIIINVGEGLDSYRYWGIIDTSTNPSDYEIQSLEHKVSYNRFDTNTISSAGNPTGYIYFVWNNVYGEGSIYWQPLDIHMDQWYTWTQQHVQTNGLTNIVRIWRSHEYGNPVLNDMIFESK